MISAADDDDLDGYRWVPGEGPDSDAIARLKEAFPKPQEAMGEAWFIGDVRKTFPELMGNLDALDDEQFTTPLWELSSGPGCFGPREEWTDWYHFLLPRLVERNWRRPLHHPAELLVTGFISQHPDSRDPMPYAGFRRDALLTLGRLIMAPDAWPDDKIHLDRALNKHRTVDGNFCFWEASGPLSASLFFCLKYLPQPAVGPWFESVRAITNPVWTEQVAVWLIGAHRMLTGEAAQPDKLDAFEQFGIGWEASYLLHGRYDGDLETPSPLIEFLPSNNCAEVLRQARAWDLRVFFEEVLTNPELDFLSREMVGVQEKFSELYSD